MCHYDFNVEDYFTLSRACYACPDNLTDCTLPECIPADGVPIPLLTVNRQLPGPSIQVKRYVDGKSMLLMVLSRTYKRNSCFFSSFELT